MPKNPAQERKLKRLKKRIVIGLVSMVFFTLGFTCVMIALLLRRPLLVSPVPQIVGKQLVNADTAAINIVKKELNTDSLFYDSIDIASQRSIIIKLKSGEEVILSQDKDLVSQIRSLQLTLNHFTIEGRKISRIDFRFENPVITQQK